MGGEDADKIIRVPGETLLIKVTPEEVAYRNKYLPDPTKLTDEKLVCTVCSVSLAQNVHKGKQIYIHRSLQVLVCEACFTFYGDGCFSVDEDGDDKYCRWCGQGGTLYLCSTCTCAFCQKCVKLNLKASVLADLENDDWKCYICSPRPLFGSRAICWGAEELNKMGKEKENEKLKKQKEKLGDKKKEETGRKSRKQSSSEDEVIPKKRRRGMNGSDDSSPEVMPAKRPTRASAVTRNLNGSLNKSKMKRRDSSSDIDISEEDKNVSKRSRINKKNKKLAADSSSDDDSEVKIQHKKKYKKKKAETSSDESLVEDYKIYKKRSSRKTVDSSDDESSDKKKLKKKKLSISKKKKEYSSDVSSDEKKKRVKRHKEDSNEESTDSYKKRSRKLRRKKDESSDSESEDPSKKEKKKDKFKKDIENKKKSDINSDDGEGVKGKKNNDDMILDENSEETRSKEGSSVDNLVKKRIKLAILWLDTAMKDIAELGSLISLRATKFAKKKINSENLKSYEDVLKIFSKLKQLMSGIHSNYDHIEKNLDNQLKPWKILTGLEESETDKPAEEETIFADKSVSDLQSISGNSPDSKNSKNQDVANNSSINAAHDNTLGVVGVETSTEKCDEKIKTKIDDESNDICLKWDNLSGDEDSENDNLDMTEAITKATETLDKSDEQDDLQTSKIIIHDDSKHPKEDVDDIIHDDSKSSEKVIDDRSEKVDDRTVEDFNQNNVSNNFDSSTRMSQSESDEKHSDTDKKKSKKSGYKSLLGSSKSDYKNEDTKDEVEKDDILKIPVETVTEGKDSDSEISHKKEKPLHSSSLRKEKKEKIGEDSKYNDSSLKESPRKNFKEKGQCTGQHGNSSDDVAHLSDDSSGLESFSKRLKYKWQGKEQSDNMKLKTSLGLDSSGESDTSFEPEVSEKNKAHKKKNENKDENSPNCKNHNDKRNMEDDNNTKIKKKKHDDSKSKTRKQTRKKDDEESNDEKSVPNKVKEEVKEEIDFDHHEKSPNEDIESNGKLKKEKEKIEKDADIESFKTTDPMKTKLSTLDSSTEENDEKFKASKGSDSELKNVKNSKGNKKTLKKKSILNKRRSNKTNMLESSDEDDEQSDKNKKNDQLIVSSDDENKQSNKEDDKDSESPVYMLSSEESSDPDLIQKKKVKRKKAGSSDSDDAGVSKDKTKKKRKLIRCANSSDEIGESGEENLDASQKSTQGESPGKGGRKNIKKIKGKGDLEDATIEAAEEEKERRRRVEERQKLFNEMFEIKETKILDKLVLDFDEKEKKELISVHKDLVEKMKPHQAKGVKFMWDSCFESLAQLKKKKGTGCILAHCMGLGKTFQVISLVHTLLTNEETQVHTVMVVCPLSTVLNWYNEFDKWLDGIEGGDSIEVFHLTKCKLNPERARELRRWQNNGGVLIMGYEMFRNLTCETAKKFRAKMKKDFQETLVDPGADLIVCDEGHMLKNETTALSKAMSRVKSLRRIVLTGTPMQNNLKEYHCMVQFVKPNLLGTRKEFLNRFVNPISNGQFVDSTDSDVKLMKRRAHVLHKMLEGLVQRFDYNVLTPFLPPKHEFVISLCLSELQVKLYKHYLENYSQQSDSNKAGSRLFQDWQALGRIWTHPRVLKMSTDRANILKEKKMMEDSDEEGSLKDFIDDDDSEKDTTTEESGDDSVSDGSIKSDDGKKKRIVRNQRNTRSTRSSGKKITHLESSEDEKEGTEEPVEESNTDKAWWSEMVEPEHLDDINHSAKLVLLFAILKECEMIEDKVLVFSQSLFSLDLIEYFLDKIDTATQENRFEESLGNHQGTWAKGLDYFRLDGSTSSENRNIWCKAFNREDNARARLFLISTRAGGLGINLTAANRVIIFDASWNPSHDVQSIFRVYRFGQRKPCYVYRFIAHGTMEEKVYDRQVAKQSMSNRVVDEQQVHRHFSMNDLNELYSFTPPSSKDDRPTPALPKDGLMAEILTQFSDWIEKYHEHDSLLENVVEEELNEEERKAAWEDYENDKKRGFIPQTTGTTTGMFNNPMSLQIENLRRVLKAKYPTKPEHELNQMLVYQVSLLMRQQQYGASGQMGMNAPRPQMYQTNNLTPDQLYNLQQQQYRMQYLQQLQMNPTQQSTANLRNILSKQPDYQQQMMMQQQANLARLQMQQNTSHSFLQNQLTQPSLSQLLQIPSMTSGAAAAAAQLERMSKNYQESRKGDSSIEMKNLSSKPEQTKKPST